jgi:protein-tyrosine-phosphatase
MFAAILRYYLPGDHVITSAGFSTRKWRLTGYKALPEAIDSVLSVTNGAINLDDHRATPIELFNLREFDLIYNLTKHGHEWMESNQINHTNIVLDDPYDMATQTVNLEKHRKCVEDIIVEVSRIVADITST